jgi:hypothetical protein
MIRSALFYLFVVAAFASATAVMIWAIFFAQPGLSYYLE